VSELCAPKGYLFSWDSFLSSKRYNMEIETVTFFYHYPYIKQIFNKVVFGKK